MMKTLLVTLAVAAAVARANPSQPLEESPRFGYLSLGSGDGALLQFNQTSVIQGILFSVVALVVAVVVLPFLGVDLSTIFEKKESSDPYSYAQDFQGAYTSPYAKRSFDVLSPVISALATAYKKYQ
ncbi:uncharacterized protein LOC122258523 [Penaeus japonicus]|uniref:uncharacterized protein LOC122258523 n=1 Tax=Penaeus japonicus TaxID=27405 RepID=UPI001C70C813|nr:uncharacterized protein LOC122258523 [Penaeus japonicus]XP_042880456.1 uncharacterized protein LOC122258523 [Penaeus japonicus]